MNHELPQTAMAISIINEVVYKPNTTLVIDDFHLARSMRVTALFRRFVMEMPDDFHIVILTRDTTNLDITELSAKGLCNVVSLKLETSGRTAAIRKAQKLKLL